MSSQLSPQLRSLYRRFLRELPPTSASLTNSTSTTSPQPKPTLLSHPSPLQKRLRASFHPQSSTPTKSLNARIQEAEQFVQYLRAQRMYVSLLERYNPGMNMNEEERVRLTARRVGMNLPQEYRVTPCGDGDGGKG